MHIDGWAGENKYVGTGSNSHTELVRAGRAVGEHRPPAFETCAVRDLNPGSSLGKAMSYHWTNGALPSVA
jgi:hypothetical protein